MVRVTKLELRLTVNDIISKGNPDLLTTKIIRKLCEQKYKIDLTSRKHVIDKIVMAYVSKVSGANQSEKKNGGESCNSSSDEESSSTCGSHSYSSTASSDDESVSKKEVNVTKGRMNNAAKPVPKKATKRRVNNNAAKPVPKKAKRAEDTSPTDVEKEENTANAEQDDASIARQLQGSQFNLRQKTILNSMWFM